MGKDKFSIWGLIGKTAAFLSLIWVSVQLFNYFFHKDFKLNAIGTVSEFLLPNDIITELNKVGDYELFLKACDLLNVPLTEKTLVNKKINVDLYQLENDRRYPNPSKNIANYSYIWWYTIINNGNKPVEDIQLELPFDGYFKITYSDSIKYGRFKNKVKLFTLYPGQNIKIILWQTFDYNSLSDDKEKSRITHKNGITQIGYSIEKRGFWAWNERTYGTPLFVLIVLFLFLLVISFVLGADLGPKIEIWNKETKIKELQERKKLESDLEAEAKEKKDLPAKDVDSP
jgi:hypothetical protein